jgi:topoisomerase-4 subunit A
MSAFKLTEVQAEAILNLRLRSLSKLEEMEIRAEHDRLSQEKRELNALLASDDLQWEKISGEIRDVREKYSKKTVLGRRRTLLAEAPTIEFDLEQAMVEKEPVTVILSDKGWIRAMKGHMEDTSKLDFKQGDELKHVIHAHTTDKLILFVTNGKFFTLEVSQLPGGRGHGEPVRLMIDMEENTDFVEVFIHEPGRKLLVASTAGHGFVVPEDEVLASTRKGKQVLNVDTPDEAKVCVPVPPGADHVATMGENRKMLVFPLDEVNEMARGKGVMLQKIKDGVLIDVRPFVRKEGLTWLDAAGRTFTLEWRELGDWVGQRSQAGRIAPKGFPRSNKFGPAF